MIAFALLCLPFHNVQAAEAEESFLLEPYIQELEKLNLELGTNYTFLSKKNLLEDGSSMQEMIDYFSNMSIEEFDTYIRDLHSADVKAKNAEANGTFTMLPSISPNSTSSTQMYYYGGLSNPNYLSITSQITNVNGSVYIYNSITSYDKNISAYPAYSPLALTYSFSSNLTEAYCTFKCSRYLSQYILDGNVYYIGVTFVAVRGSVFS